MDVDFEKLLLLSLALRVKQNVVDCTFETTNDSLGAIFVHVGWLVVHDNLLFELQVGLAENQNFTLTSNVNFGSGANSRENFNSLILAVNCSNQPEVIRGEEVNLTGVLPNQLVLMALKFVSPCKNQFRTNVFDVSWLKVIKFLRVVRTIVNPQ